MSIGFCLVVLYVITGFKRSCPKPANTADFVRYPNTARAAKFFATKTLQGEDV